MRFYSIYLLLLFLFVFNVSCKGGGGGGGGGRGGGGSSGGGRGTSSSGGGSFGKGSSGSGSGTGSSGSGSSGSGSSGRSSSSGRSGPAPSYERTPGGGFGSFKSNPPSYRSSNSRQNFNHYNPTYSGTYGATGRYSGHYGNYRPGFPYFFVLPSFMFMGYYGTYHRYNNQGSYYAPEIASQGTGSTNILINGTTYTGESDNFHYTFNITARSDQFVTLDMGYLGSSDLNTNPADFIYRLTMAHVVEFDDLNNNGFYDAQEPILAISSLQKLNWQPMALTNRTVPNNPMQSYLETVTAANVTYNNTGTAPNPHVFAISMTFRSTNLQLNGTASIPLQPNSVQYDVQLQNYPSPMAGVINRRVALAQIVTTKPFNNIMMDVNTTTPVPLAQQIKTNVTYGVSVGNYSEGRLEYQPTVNITNMAGISTFSWTNLMDPAQVNRLNDPNTWGWGSVGVDNRASTMLLVTFNNSTTSSLQFSGLAYLDTDVINSAINAGSALFSPSSKLVTQGATALSVVALLILSL